MPAADDVGVSNERTALAWQRTALSLLAGSAFVTRLTFEELGALAFLCTVLAVPTTVWVFGEGRLRYLHHEGSRPRPRGRGGRAAACLALGTLGVAVTELAALLRS